MALIAIHAVVDVAADTLMLGICLRLAMTLRALENRVIVRVDMARRANPVRVAVIGRERSVLRMVERRLQPVGRVVTVLASRGEELRLGRMSGIRCRVVVGLVAAHAGRR